jgi:isocitrate dehydrogenase
MSDFNKHLQDWHKSIESEFQATESQDAEEILKVLRTRLMVNVLELADNLVQMAKYSESDSVRLNATKYAISLALPLADSPTPGTDSLDVLIAQLTSNTE